MKIGDINREGTEISMVIFILNVTLRKCLNVCDCWRMSERKEGHVLQGAVLKHGIATRCRESYKGICMWN